MANLNKVMLIGNLARDPELKYTNTSCVCKLAVAVNRQWKNANGELQKQVDFFNVVVWGKAGENCQKYLTKGRPVFIEGRLQNRSWEHEGQKRYATDIIAENVQYLNPGNRQGGEQHPDQAEQQSGDYPPVGPDDKVPF